MAGRGMGRVYHKGNRISHNVWVRKTNWSYLKKNCLVLRDKEVDSKDNSRFETFHCIALKVFNIYLCHVLDIMKRGLQRKVNNDKTYVKFSLRWHSTLNYFLFCE